MSVDRAIAQICQVQHGAASRDQLRLAHIDTRSIARRIQDGVLLAPTPNVITLAGSPVTAHQAVMISLLDAGPGACASHHTALALHELPGFSLEPVHVTQPRAGILRPHSTAITHTSRRMPPDHMALVHGIPTTTATRALFDLAAFQHPARLAKTLDACWTRGLTDHDRLIQALLLLARRGRRGITVMRELIAERGAAYLAPESGLEHRFHRILAEDGQPPLLRQVVWETEIGTFRLDSFDDRVRVAFEIDSDRHHSSLTDLASDARREAAIVATGVTVVHVREHDVWYAPASVASAVRRHRRL